MPPVETYSTRLYVFPTCCPVSISSVTAVMMLGPDPSHTKVAMTVLPSGGVSGLNSLLHSRPLCGMVPLNPHKATPDAVSSARSPGVPGLRLGGVTASEQPAASRAAARSRVDVIRPPLWSARHVANARLQRRKVHARASRRVRRSQGADCCRTVGDRCYGRCGDVPMGCMVAGIS